MLSDAILALFKAAALVLAVGSSLSTHIDLSRQLSYSSSPRQRLC